MSKRVVWRPFPMKQDGDREVYDKDTLRDQYLNQNIYRWQDFCASYSYDPSPVLRGRFPVRIWQQQWMRQQIESHEERLINPAFEVKRFISDQRLLFPKVWNEAANAIKFINDHFLSKTIKEIRWDQEHEQEIWEGTVKSRVSLKPSEIVSLGQSQRIVQDIQREALLVPSQESYAAMVPIRDTDPEVVEAEAEGDRLRAIGTRLISGEALTDDKMTALLDRWIDNQSRPQEPEPEDDMDIELPLEDA